MGVTENNYHLGVAMMAGIYCGAIDCCILDYRLLVHHCFLPSLITIEEKSCGYHKFNRTLKNYVLISFLFRASRFSLPVESPHKAKIAFGTRFHWLEF